MEKIFEKVARYFGISIEEAKMIDLMDLTDEDMDAIDAME